MKREENYGSVIEVHCSSWTTDNAITQVTILRL